MEDNVLISKERLRELQNEAWRVGYDEGYDEGYHDGHSEGYAEAQDHFGGEG